MIDQAFAQTFVSAIRRKLGICVNIMNEKGVIIASASPERIGSFHSLAYQIIQSRIPEQVTDAVSDGMIGVTSPGVNLLLTENHEPIGVVGVSGPAAELHQVARIIQYALEAEIRHQNVLPRRAPQNYRFDALTQALLFERPAVPSRILREARAQKVDAARPRRCVLVRPMNDDGVCYAELLHALLLYTQEHPSVLLLYGAAQQALLIFPYTDEHDADRLSEELRQLERQTLQLLPDGLAEQPCAQYLIGPGVPELSCCADCFDLMQRLLKAMPASAEPVVLVRDFLFFVLSEASDLKTQDILFEQTCQTLRDNIQLPMLRDTISALVLSDMRLEQAARSLYIHKNTLSLRIRKIKQLLNLHSMTSLRECVYLMGLLQYLNKL